MKSKITSTKYPIKIWARDLDIEAETQARNIANLPFLFSHVALMPDAHVGKGSTIGTVLASKGAILPAAVGVDIGCGMCALKLPLKIFQIGNLPSLRSSIERSIPVGHRGNRSLSERAGKKFASLGIPPTLEKENALLKNAGLQFGSLGGGNHFIEICGDQNADAWILLHSGSRNIGKVLAEMHISKAKGLMRERLESISDPDLAHLTENTPEFNAYIGDMFWAQNFAKENREEMLLRVLKDISHHQFGDARLVENFSEYFRVNCHHNYCQQEHHFGQKVWLTRKGAVSARLGEYGIIPGSMGTKSYIVRGKGNPESFFSCSHGAGRKLSRTRARATFNEKDLAAQTQGIECRKDRSIVDEIPSAYKDIEEVMRDQEDLVESVYELKQILCVKGD